MGFFTNLKQKLLSAFSRQPDTDINYAPLPGIDTQKKSPLPPLKDPLLEALVTKDTNRLLWILFKQYQLSQSNECKQELFDFIQKNPKIIESLDENGYTILHRCIDMSLDDLLVSLFETFNGKFNPDVRAQPDFPGNDIQYVTGFGPSTLHYLVLMDWHCLYNRKLFDKITEYLDFRPTVKIKIPGTSQVVEKRWQDLEDENPILKNWIKLFKVNHDDPCFSGKNTWIKSEWIEPYFKRHPAQPQHCIDEEFRRRASMPHQQFGTLFDTSVTPGETSDEMTRRRSSTGTEYSESSSLAAKTDEDSTTSYDFLGELK